MKQKKRDKKTTVPGGTRTPNPQIRSLMRYPLRHWDKLQIFVGESNKLRESICGRVVKAPDSSSGPRLRARVRTSPDVRNFVFAVLFLICLCVLCVCVLCCVLCSCVCC